MAITAVIKPGAVTSGSNISLPEPYPDISQIVSCIHVKVYDGTNVGGVTTPTATKVDDRTFTINEDTTDYSALVLIYIAKGEISGF